MFKIVFLCSIFFVANYSQAQEIEYDDDAYYEETVFPVWGGPGWYGDVYINNENEYWNHYNQHYSNDNDQRNDHNRGNQQNRGAEGHGGGHGGGGHR